MKKNKIVDHWSFWVRKDGRTEKVIIRGYEAANKTEARKAASKSGRIVESITVYEKEK
jgi:hypothetical protein